jgi:hypothetical protein
MPHWDMSTAHARAQDISARLPLQELIQFWRRRTIDNAPPLPPDAADFLQRVRSSAAA